jgi:hypothetical protein
MAVLVTAMTEFVADFGDDSINFGAAIIVPGSRGRVRVTT